jgi:histone H3/H4
MTSNKVLSADNQQERLRLINPWYITGLVDGEGSFHIALYKDKHMKTAIKVIPEFHISQNYSSIRVLKEVKKYFQCGNIKANHQGNQKDQTYVLVIRNRNDLAKKIIPFFQKYQLRTKKAKDFQIFSKIVQMMLLGKHQEIPGVKQIIKFAYQMNDHGKRRTVKQRDLLIIAESSETIRGNLNNKIQKKI